MAVSAELEDNLHQNQSRESSHGQEQGVPDQEDLFVQPLLRQPDQRQQHGSRFYDEDRPGFHCPERNRAEHEQTESAVQKDCVNSSDDGFATHFVFFATPVMMMA